MGEWFICCMIYGYLGFLVFDFWSEGFNLFEFVFILLVIFFLEDSGGSVFECLNVKFEDVFFLNVFFICFVFVMRYVLKKKLYFIY